MKRNPLFYLITFGLMIVILVCFVSAYQRMNKYVGLTWRTGVVYSTFQTLSRQIKSAAILHPSLVQASNSAHVTKLFYTDSASVFQELALLKRTLTDPVNINISKKLDEQIKREFNWILVSNVPDSIEHHRSHGHIASLKNIDSLITAGITRTSFLQAQREQLLQEAIDKVRLWMLLFIGLAALVLLYTLRLLFLQTSKTKVKEKELATANRLLVNAQHLAKIGNWQYNTTTGQLNWSDEVYNIWGISKGAIELNYQAYLQTVHPQDREKLEEGLASFLEREQKYDIEHRIILPDHTTKWVHSLGKKTDGPNNQVIIEGTVQDITAQKKAEEDLIYNETKYRSLVESSMNGILLTVKNGSILAANKAACQMFNMTEEEILQAGRNNLVDKADPRLHMLLEERERTGQAKGEVTFLRKDGSKFEGEIGSVVFTDANGEERTSMIMRDITERKRAEADNFFKANLLNTIGQAIVATDNNGLIYYWNKAAEKIYGWSAKEALGQLAPQLISAHHSKEQADEIRESVLTHEPWEGEFLVQRKDGQTFPAFVTVTATYGDRGQFSGVIALSSDISERKKIEEQIIDNERKYRQIVETAQEGIWIMDENGITTFVNQKMCELLEYSAEEMVGRTNFSFRKYENREAFFQRAEMRKHGMSETHESVFYSKSRKEIYTKISTSPFYDHEGSYIGSLAMVTDITDLKKVETELIASESRFRSLIEKSADGIALISKEGIINYLSPSAERIIEFTKEEVIGTDCHSLIAPEYLHITHSTIEEVSKLPDVSKTVEYESIAPNGKRKWLESTYTNLLGESAVKGIVVNFRDITERKQAHESIRLSELKLQKAHEIGKLGYWQQDLGSDIIWASKEAKAIYGFPATEGEMPRQKITACILDIMKVRQATIDLVEHQKEYKIEIRIMPADGTPMKYVSAMAELQKNESGDPVRLVGTLQDITEIEKSKQEIIKSEARFRNAQTLGKLGHWELNLENNGLLWSDEIYRIFGLDKKVSTLDFDAFINFVHPDDREMVQRETEAALAGLTSFNIFHRIVLEDGSIRHVHEVAEVVKNDTGKAVKFAGMVQDVTEQKKLEEDLRISETNYKLLFDQNPVPLWMVGLESSRFMEVNEAAVFLYGYTADEFLQMSVFDIHYRKNDNMLKALNKEYKNVPFEDIVKHRKKNGDIIFVKVTIRRIVYKEKEVLLSAIRDVTNELNYQKALKENQEQLALIYNTSIDPMWLINVLEVNEYRYETINNAFSNIAGIAKDKVIGKLLEEVLPPHNIPLIKAKYKEAILTRQPVSFVTINQFVTGEVVTQVKMVPIINEENKVVQLLGTGNNITYQENARKELLKINMQLRNLAARLQDIREEERTSIAREIHDELGQQLTGLKMDMAWLNRKLVNEDENIRTKIKGSLQLIDGTINTVRKIASDLRPAILDDLGLSEAIDWHGREFSKRTSIAVVFTSEVPDTKFSPAITIAFFRIYQEALTNVARYANATVVLSSLRKTEKDLLLVITDNGKGFNQHQQTERKTLGLLGMQERVEMLGGSYNISSEPGKGTTVSVHIPIV